MGRKMIEVLQERNIQAEFIPFASARSAGQTISIGGKDHTVLELNPENIKSSNPNYALFSAGGTTAKTFAPIFNQVGCVVIDNSSAFRQQEDIPLIVPEANILQLSSSDFSLISNPNCTTIASVVALSPLHRTFGIKRIVYTTFQATSGAGANPTFAHPIDNNLIPNIDGEEEKMVFETRKILGAPKIKVSATCVRVPIKNCHSIAINVSFKKRITMESVIAALSAADGVKLCELPMPIVADGNDAVHVGRLRLDTSHKNTLNMFISNDNIRKGAATNAVQILEYLLQNDVQ